jgi:uncharacterized protein (DUF433 family)
VDRSDPSHGRAATAVCPMRFDRITVDPDLVGGAPTVRGLWIPVATVVSILADGITVDEICRSS